MTLTGAGGMGKTRLAMEVAARSRRKFPDGVWVVELAALSEPTLLSQTVSGILPDGRQESAVRSPDEVAYQIGDRPMMVVLDNCEHLLEACGHLVDTLVRSCPRLHILATSREALGVDGEQRCRVGPLQLPGPGPVDTASLTASEAGQLFLQRAVATVPDFVLTDDVIGTVAEICERLDGMPLAIELAAACIASLSPQEILERLDDRFRLLAMASRVGAPRHQTLAATLDWSHDLLSPSEAALLRRVSLFSGWTVEAAAEVCSGGGVDERDVVELLSALVRKSLIVVDTDGRARYGMLETVREWARGKLDATSEGAAVARRHAVWYADLAERAAERLTRSDAQQWLDRLEVEHDNLRAALEWTQLSGEVELGVRLSTALASFWLMRTHVAEAERWLDWAVSVSDQCSVPLRAQLFRQAGLLHGMLGDITSALQFVEESSGLFAQIGDDHASLCVCNSMFHMFRNPRESLPGLEEEIRRCRLAGDNDKLAHLIWMRGQAHFLLGEMAQARERFEETVELGQAEVHGDPLRLGLLGLARLAVLRGEPEAAEAALSEARAAAQALADIDGEATVLGLLGDLARTRGDWESARHLLGESLRLARELGAPLGIARGTYFAARLAAADSSDGLGDATELFEEALLLGREASAPPFHEVRCLLGLGWVASATGDGATAVVRLLEAQSLAQAVEDVHASAQILERLSRVARAEGRLDEAERLAYGALELHHRLGDVAGTATSLEAVAGLAVDRGRWPIAARLLAAAQGLLDRSGYARARTDQAHYDRDADRVRAVLADADLSTATAEGASMSAKAAVSYATRGRGNRSRPASGWESLTRAERQVAELVGHGLTSPEVGRRLYISARTVGHHLSHIYRKLGIHSRAELIKEVAKGRLELADSDVRVGSTFGD